MKIGLSSYSLSRAIGSGQLGILEAIDWIANAGGEHMEVVPGGAWDSHTPGLPEKLAARAKEARAKTDGESKEQGHRNLFCRELDRSILFGTLLGIGADQEAYTNGNA